MSSEDLLHAFDAFADLVVDKLEARLHRPKSDWVEQTGSPLGNRRHVAAVKRRTVAGQPGARIDGRRYFLSPEALKEELARVHGKSLDKTNLLQPPVAKAAARNQMLDRLRAVRNEKS